MPTNTTFVLSPITAAAADALRATGGAVYVADSRPGYPCRRCLRDAEIGEELILVSHDPFETDSPYRSASPIFLHAHACEPPAAGGSLPEQLTCRQLSVRAFDDSAMMLDAVVIDGAELAFAAQRLLDDPAVAVLHVHNAVRGCWATNIRRFSPVGP